MANKSIFKRILAVLNQLLLLPVSAFISATGGFYIWYLIITFIWGANILGVIFAIGPALIITPCSYLGIMFINYLKKDYDYAPLPTFGDGESYTYESKVSHDIKTSNGTVIGTYETTETKEGSDLTIEEFADILKYVFICMIALPCRLISLAAAIIGCFTNNFYVTVKKPRYEKKYNKFLHRYFDIVVTK